MSTQALTQSGATSSESTRTPSSVREARRAGLGGEGAAGAFLGLLGTASVPKGLRLRGMHSGYGASQMFEPGFSDTHEHRLSALKAEDRSDRLSSADGDTRSSTGVDARRQAQLRGQADAETRSVEFAGLRDSRVGQGRANHSADVDQRRLAGMVENAAREQLQSRPPGAGQLEGRMKAASEGKPGVMPHGLQKLGASAPDGAGGAAVPAARTGAAAGANGSAEDGAAHRVAKILGTGRGAGEVEGNRTATPSPSAHNARSTNGRGTTEPRPGANQRAGSSASSRASGETDVAKRPEFQDFVRSIRLQTLGRHSSARIHLEPPELGRIRVDVWMAGDELRIAVRTATSEARDLLSQRAGQLREALEQHGINVGQLDVTVDSKGDESADIGLEDGSRPGREPLRGRRPEVSARSADSTVADDPDAFVEAGSDPELAAVAEARLDIRA